MDRNFRDKIYDIVANDKDDNQWRLWNIVYEIILLIIIILSFIPVCHSGNMPDWMRWMEILCCVLFMIDYFLRWIIADRLYPQGRRIWLWGRVANPFRLYPITPMAIFDILSILPILPFIPATWGIARFSRIFRFFRLLKLFRYASGLQTLLDVVVRSWGQLIAVLILLAFWLLTSAFFFNVFDSNHFGWKMALYQSVLSFTTLKDVETGNFIVKVLSCISAVLGITLVALPTGIVTSVYMRLREMDRRIEEIEATLIVMNKDLTPQYDELTGKYHRNRDLPNPETIRTAIDDHQHELSEIKKNRHNREVNDNILRANIETLHSQVSDTSDDLARLRKQSANSDEIASVYRARFNPEPRAIQRFRQNEKEEPSDEEKIYRVFRRLLGDLAQDQEENNEAEN
ncbi:MAG: ion transporter [Abditibacteriota bacterium]|nr:ion transporter [Abditibacteriota bacterium]